MIRPDHPALLKIRALCMALPDVTERDSHGSPTFFIRGKRSFLSIFDNHHQDGRLALCCAAPPGAQDTLVTVDPECFFVPPYVGRLGWVGARLDRKLPWKRVERLIRDAHATAGEALRPARSPRRRR